jgi:acyl-CoA reductase-like NAD-dependent aldehyde dehydrogenase
MSDYKIIIGGEKISTAETFPVINPATEEVIAQCPKATVEQVDQAVAAARQATQEQGKPTNGFAGTGAGWEIGGTLAWCHATADLELPVDVIQDNDEARIEVHRKPLGVVGSITPWNFPLMIAIWHTMPALRSGNTVVIKPSEYTPLTTLRAAEIINEIVPPGVFNIITGDGSLGAAMSSHPGINKMVFTGSTPTGKKIMQSAAGSLKRITLELGGNDAAIVLPDIDVEEVAPSTIPCVTPWRPSPAASPPATVAAMWTSARYRTACSTSGCRNWRQTPRPVAQTSSPAEKPPPGRVISIQSLSSRILPTTPDWCRRNPLARSCRY